MFPAQPGIVAQYKVQSLDGRRRPSEHRQIKRVIAFTDGGEPMVIGDEDAGASRQLIRADTYDNYIGMTCASAISGESSSQSNEGREGGNPHNLAGDGMTAWEIAAMEFAALRALELAGNRQLTGGSRGIRGKLKDVPAWEIHTRVPVINPDKALERAYDLLRACLPGDDGLYEAIDSYVRERLATQVSHDRLRLLAMLSDAGCFPSR